MNTNQISCKKSQDLTYFDSKDKFSYFLPVI
jgi:hypothetical protein